MIQHQQMIHPRTGISKHRCLRRKGSTLRSATPRRQTWHHFLRRFFVVTVDHRWSPGSVVCCVHSSYVQGPWDATMVRPQTRQAQRLVQVTSSTWGFLNNLQRWYELSKFKPLLRIPHDFLATFSWCSMIVQVADRASDGTRANHWRWSMKLTDLHQCLSMVTTQLCSIIPVWLLTYIVVQYGCIPTTAKWWCYFLTLLLVSLLIC